jgi:hypothetical protein
MSGEKVNRILCIEKDVIGGALMAVVGSAVAVHATSYDIGSLTQMGPGYFPFALGIILTVVGLLIAWKSRVAKPREKSERLPAEWKAWLLICLSIVSFVAFAKLLGLVAATFSTVFISALADRDNRMRDAVVLGIAMALVGVVVFWWALKIPMPLFAWRGV